MRPRQLPAIRHAYQRGITTLAVAIMLLILLSIALLFAVNVGFFEQRTTVAELRAKMARQSAEAALNVAIEYVKSNTSRITSTGTGGWLNPSSTVKWTACTNSIAICLTEEDTSRRAASYYITSLPLGDILATADESLVNAASLASGVTVTATSTVGALLCRFEGESPTGSNPCALNPTSSGPTAITLVTNTTIGSENAASEVKVTLATYRTIGGAADAPLIASGTVVGLGSMEIVAAPQDFGPVSIWSPCPVDIEAGPAVSTDPLCGATGSGIGSVATCNLHEYIGYDQLESFLLNTSSGCASASNVCGCPGDIEDMLSGHSGPDEVEGKDILDVDGDTGDNADITYFPREPLDNDSDDLDDSMFETIFAKDVVDEGETDVRQTCSPNADCAIQALTDMAPTEVDTCAGIPASTGGFYWVKNSGSGGNGGACNFPATVGSPTDPVVVVVEGGTGTVQIQGGNTKLFGMVFIRSSTTPGSWLDAQIRF
jgi:hypothetical protein